MRHLWSLLGLCLLYYNIECLLPPTKEDLYQISLVGEKYLDKQIENAINGVKEMKTVMERSGEEHKNFLDALEQTKKQKEDALQTAHEMEAKLNEEQEVCNDTMQALWEECKPCLKNTCIKYYSRTCSSGSGLVGRQLEEILNRSSPLSIWINGENMDILDRESKEQNKKFQDLEDSYTEAAENMYSIFEESMRAFEHMHHFHQPMFFQPFQRPEPLHSIFKPFRNLARDFFGPHEPYMDMEDLDGNPSQDGNANEDVIITKPFGNNRMTCREIRRNSAGCIKLREECDKCKAIQSIDCSGKKPLNGPLKKELEYALAMAERFTQEYNRILRRFEEQMFNTSSIIDMFNKQFGWVSALANKTSSKDELFQIQAVISKTSDDSEKPGDTSVSVQLFDAPPMTFTVPGDIPWSDPKFSEVVAQEALDRYKQNTVTVK